jgi:hypothetical protein
VSDTPNRVLVPSFTDDPDWEAAVQVRGGGHHSPTWVRVFGPSRRANPDPTWRRANRASVTAANTILGLRFVRGVAHE